MKKPSANRFPMPPGVAMLAVTRRRPVAEDFALRTYVRSACSYRRYDPPKLADEECYESQAYNFGVAKSTTNQMPSTVGAGRP